MGNMQTLHVRNIILDHKVCYYCKWCWGKIHKQL